MIYVFDTSSLRSLQHFYPRVFKTKHFQGLIGAKQRLQGTPVAAPFVIAYARINKGTLEESMHQQGWTF